MISMEYVDNPDDEIYQLIDDEFNKYATKNEIICNYTPFSFVAKEDNKIIGVITGHSYYKEVHIDDLIILEQYRNKHIGSKLMKTVEEHYKNKDFDNINVTTHQFQAPKFYEKCGFKLEFIRENRERLDYIKCNIVIYERGKEDMNKFKEIRPIVLGIARKNNKILVSEGYDKIKNEVFYRCIGGGIDFLEKSVDALKREFKEEVKMDINVGKFLGICENIFTYNGKEGHELILFYEVNIKDVDYKERYHVIDGNSEFDAMWVDIDKFTNKELKIYPEQMLQYLSE